MKSSACVRIEPELVEVAAGEADRAARRRVDDHVAGCGVCRARLEGYRRVEAASASMRSRPADDARIAAARSRLEAGLVDLRKRIVRYAIVPSPLGDVMIARSELGVLFVEYLSGHRGHYLRMNTSLRK